MTVIYLMQMLGTEHMHPLVLSHLASPLLASLNCTVTKERRKEREEGGREEERKGGRREGNSENNLRVLDFINNPVVGGRRAG